MKKLNKKQRLIVFVAILVVTVIMAIIITTNIISSNKQIASGDYKVTTANAGSTLVANYIKEGITIGGITGTLKDLDTSDATATPEDILWGKTAYVKGEKITGTKIVTVAHAKAAQKTFEENTILIDEYGNEVKVPAGFKIASDSAINVTGGVVIEDVSAGNEYTKGSQFVWIPNGNVLTDNNGNSTSITLGRYNFDKESKETLVQSVENWSNTSSSVIITNEYGYQCKEFAVNNSYANSKAKNLEDFATKATSSRGYYIGRFEAGDAKATDSQHISSGISNPVTCKKSVYPYSYVSQPQAATLCRGMYSSNSFDSDLINSYAWDTALVFIQTFSGDNKYSMQYGFQKELVKCGEATDGTNYDIRCNIFDMAGNTREWTTENNISGANDYCIFRGGAMNGGFFVNKIYTHYRNPSTTNGSITVSLSFRPILYL